MNLPDSELNILSLEDSTRDFEIIHECLIDAGFKMSISRVDKEDQFISSLRNNRYDIILADFKLPGFNAFAALKWAQEICPDVPFLCISGSIGEETAIELIRQGAVDYIIKDRLGRLPFAIKRALDEAKDREAKRIASELLRASEEALVKSEERYRIAMQASRDGLFDWNLLTNEIYLSPGWKKILGYDEGELENRIPVWEQLMEPGDLWRSREMFNALIERRLERFEMVYRMKHRNGHWVYILSRGNTFFEENGKAVRVVGTHVDISERVRTEKILQIQYNIAREMVQTKNIEQLVKSAQSELSSFLDTRNFFLALYDREKDTLKQVIFKDEMDDFGEWKTENSLSGIVVKEAKTLLLKRSEIEHIAKTFNLLLLGTQAECWLGVPLSTGDKVIGAMVVQSYSDPNAYDLASAALMEIIANELSTFIVKKRAEEKILLMNEELELRVAERTAQLQASYEEMEAFSYTVSHDLRAPVRGIHGFTKILVEDYAGKLDEEGKRVCAVIQENALRMGQLIDDLLAFSRLQRAVMQKSVIDMKALVISVYNEITDAESRLRINMTIGDIRDAYADPNLIRQVWTNLLSNAVKYTSKRKTPTISVTCKTLYGNCIYCIKDNGTGFDMKYKDKLFNVFQRLHNVKDYEGNGVGLASVKRIIQRHGGEVWAKGVLNQGAEFYFSLAEIIKPKK